jgi:hypothetical protein
VYDSNGVQWLRSYQWQSCGQLGRGSVHQVDHRRQGLGDDWNDGCVHRRMHRHRWGLYNKCVFYYLRITKRFCYSYELQKDSATRCSSYMCISLLKTKHRPFGMMVCLGYCAYRACKKVAETYEDVDASEEREKKRAEEHARVVAEQEE